MDLRQASQNGGFRKSLGSREGILLAHEKGESSTQHWTTGFLQHLGLIAITHAVSRLVPNKKSRCESLFVILTGQTRSSFYRPFVHEIFRDFEFLCAKVEASVQGRKLDERDR